MIEDDEENSEHYNAVVKFIGDRPPPVSEKELSDVLYVMGELNLFPDYIDSMSVEQAVQIYNVIESLKESKTFPKELRL